MTEALRQPVLEARPRASGDKGPVGLKDDLPIWRVDSRILTSAGLRLADAGIIVSMGVLPWALRWESEAYGQAVGLDIVLTLLLAEIYFGRAGLYEASQPRAAGSWLARLALAWAGVGGTVVALDYFLGVGWPVAGMWSLACLAPGFAAFAATRAAAFRYLSGLYRTGRLARSVAIVGSRNAARRLMAQLAPRFGTDAALAGVFELAPGDRRPLEELVKLCRNGQVDDIFVALEWREVGLLDAIVSRLRSFSVNVRLVPELPEMPLPYLGVGEFCGMPTISMVERPLTDAQAALKRALDIVVTSAALVAGLPLMLMIAAAIRLDSPGPALFRQERWGFNARRITVLKFRTMSVDAGADATAVQARRGDPRVTRVGRLLRRTSLDELPQLINVLRGDMSLVGPRPHAVAHNEYYASCIDNYLARHRLRPGITGLAQINGCRGGTDTLEKMQRRVEYDMLYIENCSIWLDLKILYLTLFVGFTHPNAY
jgi:putative colanic acid biosynthesis UDP-glucose lipid carrier transferase